MLSYLGGAKQALFVLLIELIVPVITLHTVHASLVWGDGGTQSLGDRPI